MVIEIYGEMLSSLIPTIFFAGNFVSIRCHLDSIRVLILILWLLSAGVRGCGVPSIEQSIWRPAVLPLMARQSFPGRLRPWIRGSWILFASGKPISPNMSGSIGRRWSTTGRIRALPGISWWAPMSAESPESVTRRSSLRATECSSSATRRGE